MGVELSLLALGIAFVTAVISYFLYLGLRDSEKVSWVNMAIGAGLFLLCCGWVIAATIYNGALGLFVLIQILFGLIVAVFSGIFLAISLDGWRKAAGLVVAIGIPLALFASMEAAFPYSPNQTIRRNGEEIIAKALNEYHIDKKAYPQSLDELVPKYLSDLREPKTLWGWLYTGDNEDFTLGYVVYIDKMGYGICKYSASSPKWDCPLDYSTAPFILAPTPMP
jgi:MFS family permease